MESLFRLRVLHHFARLLGREFCLGGRALHPVVPRALHRPALSAGGEGPGDKRIILVDGEPAGRHQPGAGGGRGALQHACGRQARTGRPHRAGARDSAPSSVPTSRRGDLIFVGIDVIGGLSHRDQRHLPHRHPRDQALRRRRHRSDDLGRHRGPAERLTNIVRNVRRRANDCATLVRKLTATRAGSHDSARRNRILRGIEAVPVDVQVQISSGFAGITIVGLPDKAVAESRERVRAALNARGWRCRPSG